MINRLRYEGVRQDQSTTKDSGSRRKTGEAMTWKGWAFAAAHPLIYNTGASAAASFRKLVPSKLGAWTRVRTAPKIAAKTLHQQLKAKGIDNE